MCLVHRRERALDNKQCQIFFINASAARILLSNVTVFYWRLAAASSKIGSGGAIPKFGSLKITWLDCSWSFPPILWLGFISLLLKLWHLSISTKFPLLWSWTVLPTPPSPPGLTVRYFGIFGYNILAYPKCDFNGWYVRLQHQIFTPYHCSFAPAATQKCARVRVISD